MVDLDLIKQVSSVVFLQSINHQDYLNHLYNLFSYYCPSSPKIRTNLTDKRTGKMYSNISFTTYTLTCFNELYQLFYMSGKKIIPNNIGDLLTELSLAYWICDDGSWNKVGKYVTLSTESFQLEEVNLLIDTLNKNFDLKAYKVKNGDAHKIVIPSYSVPLLRKLVLPHIPSMMNYKLGL